MTAAEGKTVRYTDKYGTKRTDRVVQEGFGCLLLESGRCINYPLIGDAIFLETGTRWPR